MRVIIFALIFFLVKGNTGDWLRYYPPVKVCSPESGYVEVVPCFAD